MNLRSPFLFKRKMFPSWKNISHHLWYTILCQKKNPANYRNAWRKNKFNQYNFLFNNSQFRFSNIVINLLFLHRNGHQRNNRPFQKLIIERCQKHGKSTSFFRRKRRQTPTTCLISNWRVISWLLFANIVSIPYIDSVFTFDTFEKKFPKLKLCAPDCVGRAYIPFWRP